MNHNYWAIRRDGVISEVPSLITHLLDSDNIEASLAVSQWLYYNTNFYSTQQACAELISDWTQSLPGAFCNADKIRNFQKQYKHILRDSFIDDAEKLININYASDSEVAERKLIKALEFEFTFVHERSMFSDYGNQCCTGELIMDITTEGFDWFPVLWEFIFNNKMRMKIQTITVRKNSVPIVIENKVLENIDVNDFLRLPDTSQII